MYPRDAGMSTYIALVHWITSTGGDSHGSLKEGGGNTSTCFLAGLNQCAQQCKHNVYGVIE